MPVQIGLSQILVLCYFATEKKALKKSLRENMNVINISFL